MKKIKVYSLVLLGAIFGLTSCDLPDFLYKIPGVSSLLPAKEEQKEEKDSSEQKPSDEGQQGQDQSGDQGDEGQGQEGQGGEGQGGDGGSGTALEEGTYSISFKTNDNDASADLGGNSKDIIAQIESGSTYVASASGSKVYAGIGGLKVGAKSAAGSLTLNFSAAIKASSVSSVKIKTAAFGTDEGVYNVAVNNETSVETDLSGTKTLSVGGSLSSISLSTANKKRIYLESVEVVVGEGGGTVDPITPGDEEGSELFETLKAYITEIACDMLQCEASELTFADEESDDALYADITYRDTENLVYVSLWSYFSEGTISEIAELLEYYLPEGAELDNDLSEAEETEIINFYLAGDYYYVIDVYLANGEEADFPCFFFDILPKEHLEAYNEYMAEE